jgi:hypothetical protein
MYRIFMTRGHRAYAVECDREFDTQSEEGVDNLFDENIKTFINYGDVIVLMEDTDDFDRYFPNYELEIHGNN